MRRLALLVAVSSVAALSGLTGPADAANGGRSDEHRRIVDYWTPERQANAIPRAMSPDAKRKPGTGGGTPTTSVIGAAWTKGETVSITTGKVFFTLHGTNYVCSGSAVESGHDNLVLTAGHCLHDGNGGPFATNWMFAPRYKSGLDPILGGWTATSLHTTPGWANPWPTSGSGFNDDAGFAVVRPNDGKTLEQALIAAGAKIPTVSFDGWTSQSMYWSFGYPAARPYTGTTLTYCAGTTRLDRDGLDTMALPCNMTGGSSGGPWLVEYTPGSPVIESLNSYGYSSMKDTMFGPLFGTPEEAAYNAAGAASAASSCTASKTTACLPAT